MIFSVKVIHRLHLDFHIVLKKGLEERACSQLVLLLVNKGNHVKKMHLTIEK